VGKPEGKRQLGRTRCRWEDNIKMDLLRGGLLGHALDRSGSGWGQLAGSCKHGSETLGSIKCGEFLD